MNSSRIFSIPTKWIVPVLGVLAALSALLSLCLGAASVAPGEALARLEGTLVFLMGLSRLEALARRLMEAGLPQSAPAAVISGENAPRPMAVRGTLKDIAEKVREAGTEAPAVIVIGGTAGMDLRG